MISAYMHIMGHASSYIHMYTVKYRRTVSLSLSLSLCSCIYGVIQRVVPHMPHRTIGQTPDMCILSLLGAMLYVHLRYHYLE